MVNNITDFIRTKQIDSFPKLYFLLFLQQCPDMKGTSQEFAGRLYFGDTLQMEEILRDLQKVGLVVAAGHGWKLSDEPDIKTHLQQLAMRFSDPLARQELLAQMKHN